MLFVYSTLLLAVMGGVLGAQTPDGFTPAVETKLDVLFNSTAVSEPGQKLTKAGTASQPQLSLSDVSSRDTFMFVMIDLDVPGQGSNTTRRTLLHALETGFKPTAQKASGEATLLASSSSGPAAYIGPSPPATDTIAHRYVQLLFQQPSNLSVSASDFSNTQARIGFDINSFMKQNGLSAPVAGNFFTVDGRASGSASGSASGTATATESGGISRNTLQPFEGVGVKRDVQWGLAGVLGGLALLAI